MNPSPHLLMQLHQTLLTGVGVLFVIKVLIVIHVPAHLLLVIHRTLTRTVKLRFSFIIEFVENLCPLTFRRIVSMYFLSGWLYLMDSLTFLTSCSRTHFSIRPQHS